MRETAAFWSTQVLSVREVAVFWNAKVLPVREIALCWSAQVVIGLLHNVQGFTS